MPPAYLRGPALTDGGPTACFVWGCSGKVGLTRTAARAIGRRKLGSTAYPCGHCGQWHTVHPAGAPLSPAQLRRMGQP